MKRILSMILAMSIMFSLVACGTSPSSNSSAGKQSSINQDNLIILGGSSSAVWTIAAAQVGEMIKEIYPDKTINVEPGGAIANYQSVNNGDAQIGLCITCTSWEAWNGASETFE